MRARHGDKGVAHRARGGGVHHPDNRMKHVFISADGLAAKVKSVAGEGDRAKMHAARRARGGTCWYCGDNFDKKARGGGIHIKKSHHGLLHKNLGVAQGHKIPAKALTKAKHSSNPAVRKRATFAINAKKWHH